MKLKEIINQRIFFGLIILIAIVGILGSGYFYFQYQQTQQKLKNPQFAVQEETRALIERVNKLIILPTDEIPTIATVSDPERLKDQPFFARAKNGDKLLIYNNARKAILYDPIANKIIDVAPVNIGTASATTSAQLTPNQKELKFVLYNGTPKTGLTVKYEEILKKTISNTTVVDRANAKKNDYEKSVLIDLGTQTSQVSNLSKELGITVGLLPEGESKPTNADFLIILGKDKENI